MGELTRFGRLLKGERPVDREGNPITDAQTAQLIKNQGVAERAASAAEVAGVGVTPEVRPAVDPDAPIVQDAEGVVARARADARAASGLPRVVGVRPPRES